MPKVLIGGAEIKWKPHQAVLLWPPFIGLTLHCNINMAAINHHRRSKLTVDKIDCTVTWGYTQLYNIIEKWFAEVCEAMESQFTFRIAEHCQVDWFSLFWSRYWNQSINLTNRGTSLLLEQTWTANQPCSVPFVIEHGINNLNKLWFQTGRHDKCGERTSFVNVPAQMQNAILIQQWCTLYNCLPKILRQCIEITGIAV